MDSAPGAAAGGPTPRPRHWPAIMQAAARCASLPAEAGLQCAVLQGYSHWYIDGNLQGESPTGFPSARLKALRESIAICGVKPIYHGCCRHGLGCRSRASFDAALSLVLDEIELCNALGGAPLVVHGGCVEGQQRGQQARADGLRHLIDSLRPLVQLAAGRGVPIWLESMCGYMRFDPFRYLCTTEDEVAQVLDAVSGLHCFLDVSNAWVNGGDPVSMFRRFHTRTAGLSVDDLTCAESLATLEEQGRPPFSTLLLAAQAVGWSGVITFMPESRELTAGIGSLTHLPALPLS